jgi:ERCC4-related helicase
VARKIKRDLYVILQIFINKFSDNAYVIKYKERTLAAMESTNVLHEEDDENISMEEEVCGKEKEEYMDQPKLGDVLEPLKDDSNTQTQNSIVIFKNPCPSRLLIIMSVAWMSYMIML